MRTVLEFPDDGLRVEFDGDTVRLISGRATFDISVRTMRFILGHVSLLEGQGAYESAPAPAASTRRESPRWSAGSSHSPSAAPARSQAETPAHSVSTRPHAPAEAPTSPPAARRVPPPRLVPKPVAAKRAAPKTAGAGTSAGSTASTGTETATSAASSAAATPAVRAATPVRRRRRIADLPATHPRRFRGPGRKRLAEFIYEWMMEAGPKTVEEIVDWVKQQQLSTAGDVLHGVRIALGRNKQSFVQGPDGKFRIRETLPGVTARSAPVAAPTVRKRKKGETEAKPVGVSTPTPAK